VNLHFPHPEPIVVREHELRVVRRFPSESQIAVKARDRVTPDTVLGKSDPRAVAVRVPIAEQLDLAAKDVARHLMRPVGSTFAAGEPLARARRGMRNVVVGTPVAGTLVEVEPDSGVALIAPAGAGEVRALVPGDVEEIVGKSAVGIRTVGARVLGIVGLGAAAAGPLRLAVERPNQELAVDRVGPAMAGAIVVAGTYAGAAAIRKLVEVGAAGLVCGSIVEREIAAAFGWQAEDRLAPWRQPPGERAIGDGLPVPLAIIATEGFGAIPMNPLAFELIGELGGQRAVVLPTTRVVGQAARPELIVPDESLLDQDAASSQALLVPGVPVRAVDHAHLGWTGVVASAPRRERYGDGLTALAVEVDFSDGVRRLIRAANLEVMN
jgi:hypothetical protein